MNDKYEFTGETKVHFGITLHRIRAKVAIGMIAAGTVGGWIESEKNLSVYGDAWVYGNAQVYGDARVYGNAQVYGNARVYGDARVSGDARVFGNAQVYGDAWVYGDARVYGDAGVCLTLKIATRSDGYTFSLLPLSDGSYVVTAGCRYGTIDALRKHWTDTRGGTVLGDESIAILDFFEHCIELDKKHGIKAVAA